MNFNYLKLQKGVKSTIINLYMKINQIGNYLCASISFYRLKKIRPQGYVLLLSMVFLMMLTLLAISVISLNTTQTRIATNHTNTEISLEKAEGALNEAINKLIKGTYNPKNFMQNGNGLYLLDPSAPPIWTTINWSSSSAVISGFKGSSGASASYIIEQLPSVVSPGQNMKTPTSIYRITVRAVGAGGNEATILQSTVQIQ